MTRLLPIALLVLLLVAGSAAGDEMLQATDRSSGLALVRAESGWVVVRDGVEPQSFDPGASFSPFSIASLANGWLVTGTIRTGDSTELAIFRGGSHGARPIEAPGGRIAPRRGNPVAFIDAGRWLGVAWVEGSRQSDLRVRSAEWLGDGWGPVEEVSPGGPGSPIAGAQLAPAAAVTPAGEWLLLWAGFDGQDDEIFWSQRRQRTWDPPNRLHADNPVPDITPTVVTAGAGALAAWSSFDKGHYRLRMARFVDGVWEQVSGWKGGLGELYPQALALDGAPFVLHRSVVPDGWVLLEIDTAGRPARRSFAGAPTPGRPRVRRSESGGPQLSWALPKTPAGRPTREREGSR